MVATMDMRRSQSFFSVATPHRNGEELSNNIGLNIIKALKMYQQTHKDLPDRILFYRGKTLKNLPFIHFYSFSFFLYEH